MKLLGTLLILSLLFSCSKNSPEPIAIVDPLPVAGAVRGNIMAYDKYGNGNPNYNDVSIKLIDKQNQVFNGTVSQNGAYSFDNVVMGNVTLIVNKPGYGFIDSVLYNHQKVFDTLTVINLIEELPFSFQLYSPSYSNGMFGISGAYNYISTDSYMVSQYTCMSKDPEVSINHTNVLRGSGSYTNVQYIRGFVSESSSMSLSYLTNAGFKIGDRIYVRVIPSILKFWESYHDQNKNYQVLHYKVGNASNTVSFILSQ